MKIKQDFVTNSSSMSYVVFFPETLNPDEMLSITEHLGMLKNSAADVQIVKDILYGIKCSEYWTANDWYEQEVIWNEVNTSFNYAIKILHEFGVPVKGIDTGPDNIPVVYNLGTKPNLEKARNHPLSEVYLQL